MTATFPYLVMTIFFIRSIMLPGADRGIMYMFTPDVSKIFPQVFLYFVYVFTVIKTVLYTGSTCFHIIYVFHFVPVNFSNEIEDNVDETK